MKKSITTIALVLFVSLHIKAQFSMDWQQSIGGLMRDEGKFVFLDSNKIKVFIEGQSSDGDFVNAKGGFDCWILDYDFTGNLLSKVCFGSGGNERIMAAFQTSKNEYYLSGFSNSYTGDFYIQTDTQALYVAKFNSSNQLISYFPINDSDSCLQRAICVTHDNYILITGYTYAKQGAFAASVQPTNPSNFNDFLDAFLVKLDTTGNVVWIKIMGGSKGDAGLGIIENSDNRYIWTVGSGSSDYDFSVPGTNNGGTFYLTLEENGTEASRILISAGDSGVVTGVDVLPVTNELYVSTAQIWGNVGGDVSNIYNSPFEEYDTDIWVCKYDTTGLIMWDKNLGGLADDYPVQLISVSDTEFLVFGYTWSNDFDVFNNNGGEDFWLVKMNLNGSVINSKTFGGSRRDRAWDAVKISENKYALIGTTESEDKDVIFNHSPGPYGSDAWLVIVSDTSVVSSIQDIIYTTPNLHPNPSTTTITLNGTEAGSTATITNLHGQVLLQLTVNNQQQSINIEHLPPGMYFCMVQTGGQHKVLRFVRE